MNFSEQLNYYIDTISCSSQDLANATGISPSAISRYRKGERQPKLKSSTLESLASGLAKLAKESDLNITKKTILTNLSISLNDISIDFSQLKNNLNNLILNLHINMKELSRFICIDTSAIYRIRTGHITPRNPLEFIENVCKFIVKKHSDQNSKEIVASITNSKLKDLEDNDNYFEIIKTWMSSNASPNNSVINSFLTNLDNFNLEEYIKVIKFDEIKVPFVPFYNPTAKTYTGIKEMRQGELDFFKATVLSKSNETVFMCNDVPMEKLAEDTEWAKKYMFGIAMMLKKGIHINMIHTLNRPFKEIMLGLENWIPLYMTGQVSAYYLKDFNDTIYTHTNYVSGTVALTGDSIRSYQEQGRYYLITNKKDVEYYKNKSQLLLSKAIPLFNIYTNNNKKSYYEFIDKDSKCSGRRKRSLCSLPLHTISEELLLRILKHNNISKDLTNQILLVYKQNIEIVSKITKENIFEDVIADITEESFKDSPMFLSVIDAFIDTKIYYTYEEYLEHLELSKEYAKSNKNYILTTDANLAFKNIQITICENKWAMFSKITHPAIHFHTTHPTLCDCLEKFTPPIIDKN